MRGYSIYILSNCLWIAIEERDVARDMLLMKGGMVIDGGNIGVGLRLRCNRWVRDPQDNQTASRGILLC